MIKLRDILTEINKNSLEYLSSITTDINEPFNPPRYLYHLSSQQNIPTYLAANRIAEERLKKEAANNAK